jgi:hypothetical protein
MPDETIDIILEGKTYAIRPPTIKQQQGVRTPRRCEPDFEVRRPGGGGERGLEHG